MIDGFTLDRLHQLLRRESRSLFQYCREVPPWTNIEDDAAGRQIRSMAAAELVSLDELGRHLQKRHVGLLHLGPFPSNFTNFNDAALHFLLPRMVAEQKKLLVELEQDVSAMDDAKARPCLNRLLELKRKHASELAGVSAGKHSVV